MRLLSRIAIPIAFIVTGVILLLEYTEVAYLGASEIWLGGLVALLGVLMAIKAIVERNRYLITPVCVLTVTGGVLLVTMATSLQMSETWPSLILAPSMAALAHYIWGKRRTGYLKLFAVTLVLSASMLTCSLLDRWILMIPVLLILIGIATADTKPKRRRAESPSISFEERKKQILDSEDIDQ